MMRKLLYSLALGMSAAAPARASWPCEVALCMSDPRGPTTESACRPPVERALREWARGRTIPACQTESGDIAIRRFVLHWEDCPAGTQMIPGGVRWAAQGTMRIIGNIPHPAPSHAPLLVAGANYEPSVNDPDIPRACVSGRSQDTYITLNQDDTASTVTVYERMILRPRQYNRYHVELWQNGVMLSTTKGW